MEQFDADRGQMLARAREVATADGLTNVTFEQADAQVHRFAEARFDAVISRFGVMFFGDPVAAFANLARATRPGGRLAVVTWQRFARRSGAEDQEEEGGNDAAHAAMASSRL